MTVSQLRWDPLTLSWVIITGNHGRRPQDFILERQHSTMESCPFCYGHEGRTTSELFAVRPADSGSIRHGTHDIAGMSESERTRSKRST